LKRSTKQVMRDTLKGKYDCDFALTQISLSLLFPGYAVIARGIVLSASSRGWGAPQLAYVVGAAHGISIIDIARQRVTGTMTIAGNPRTVLLNPDGHALYVTQPMLGRVAVISAKTGKTLCTASLPGQPSLLALSLDATVLYAAGQGDTSVRALDPVTCAVQQTFQTHESVYGLAVTASTARC
jgi:DNA-binding beta-propeller fold protein YncE